VVAAAVGLAAGAAQATLASIASATLPPTAPRTSQWVRSDIRVLLELVAGAECPTL
jgi:hypothetical protein